MISEIKIFSTQLSINDTPPHIKIPMLKPIVLTIATVLMLPVAHINPDNIGKASLNNDNYNANKMKK
jgi:hypothetical protein